MSRPPDPTLLDEATGLSSRRHFDIVYDFLFRVADRGVPVTLAFFGLHPDEAGATGAGTGADSPLAAFSRVVAEATRATDLAARFDAHRLVALLVDCNQQGGLIYADRVLDGARGFRDETGRDACAGLAAYEKGTTGPGVLIERGLAALDGALASGGGSVFVPSDLDGGGT